MRNRAKIICFMGLDGSGKSTSIDYAYRFMKTAGYKVEIVRAAYVVKYLNGLIKLGKKLLLKKNSNPFSGDYATYLKDMREQAKRGWTYKIFSTLTTFEFKCQILINVRLKHLLGINLLVDRYIYDNVVTYAANLGLGEKYMTDTLAVKWKSAPRPDGLIYIKTSVPVCCSRKDDIPSPLYLEIREPLYDQLASICGATIISGEQNKKKMLSQVEDEINRLM